MLLIFGSLLLSFDCFKSELFLGFWLDRSYNVCLVLLIKVDIAIQQLLRSHHLVTCQNLMFFLVLQFIDSLKVRQEAQVSEVDISICFQEI